MYDQVAALSRSLYSWYEYLHARLVHDECCERLMSGRKCDIIRTYFIRSGVASAIVSSKKKSSSRGLSTASRIISNI